MHESVEDPVGDRALADEFVPGIGRLLAGDEGGAGALAVVEDFQEESVLVRFHGGEAKIVDDQQVDAGQFPQQSGEAAVGLGDGQLSEEFGFVVVQGAVSLATGFVGQGAAEEGLTDPGGAGDEAAAGGLNRRTYLRKSSRRVCTPPG